MPSFCLQKYIKRPDFGLLLLFKINDAINPAEYREFVISRISDYPFRQIAYLLP